MERAFCLPTRLAEKTIWRHRSAPGARKLDHGLALHIEKEQTCHCWRRGSVHLSTTQHLGRFLGMPWWAMEPLIWVPPSLSLKKGQGLVICRETSMWPRTQGSRPTSQARRMSPLHHVAMWELKTYSARIVSYMSAGSQAWPSHLSRFKTLFI